MSAPTTVREAPARLQSAVAALALHDVPPHGLEIGCGGFPAAHSLASVLPGWQWIALDVDPRSLRRAARASATLIAADAERLPLTDWARFGLILVRHPDIFRRRAWGRILPRLTQRLAPGGTLLITLYGAAEAQAVRALQPTSPFVFAAENLAPASRDGRDRIILAFQLAPTAADA